LLNWNHQSNKGIEEIRGIASFAIAMGVAAIEFSAIIFAGIIGVINGGSPGRSSPVIAMIALMIIFCGLGYVIGLALGIAGATNKHRKKIFAVLDIVLNILGFSLLAGLIMLTTMLEHH
jgi:ABC-type proline/glycine betaine transport system permease subunit